MKRRRDKNFDLLKDEDGIKNNTKQTKIKESHSKENVPLYNARHQSSGNCQRSSPLAQSETLNNEHFILDEGSENKNVPERKTIDTGSDGTQFSIKEICFSEQMNKVPLEPEGNASQESEQEEPTSLRKYRSDSTSSSPSSSSSTSSSSSSSLTSCSSTNSKVPDNIEQCASTSTRISIPRPNYRISPIHSNESDVDLSDTDPTFHCELPSQLNSPASAVSSENKPKNSKKRSRNPLNWKQNRAKFLRNTGKAYKSLSKTRKEIPARRVKSPCDSKCRLKCKEKLNIEQRNKMFNSYWALGNVELQRSFLKSCMLEVKPKYQYTNARHPRQPNSAFYFTLNEEKIRVCKTFFIRTLDISDRQIRTVKSKSDGNDFLEEDQRGRHKNKKVIDPEVIKDIKTHINSIPRIESHYLRANTSREFIDGGKTVKDLWRDYQVAQKQKNKEFADYWLYYHIFTHDFNISFHKPKKYQCDLCTMFQLSSPDQKNILKEKYDFHLQEKDLCRTQKRIDRENISSKSICAVYDMQATMPLPAGYSSAFYYKSKLNCQNFTIVELSKKDVRKKTKGHEDVGAYDIVHCYFWDETHGRRGANEIGSCIFDYLKKISARNPNEMLDIIFYSDNCGGQNKNKFIVSLYSYAVSVLYNINTITHNFLIKGHTQNEGDNVHSLIEKERKRNLISGPIYIPHQYVTIIKNAKKTGKPFIVHEVTYDFFLDLKNLQEEWAYNFTEDEHPNIVAWTDRKDQENTDVKIMKFSKNDPHKFLLKTSYSQPEYNTVDMRNKRKKMKSPDEITTIPVYQEIIKLSEKKKKRLKRTSREKTYT